MTSSDLRVLTLNCWGVFTPIACKDRYKRIHEIGLECAKGKYDVIQLQEIWLESDYLKLENMMASVYPYSVHFNSGIFGSGLVTFSKYEIQSSTLHTFTLNGYAVKFYHGDWYGAKCVSLCKILFNDSTINFYNTHLHAQYHQGINDEYLTHRTLQAFELAQFINMTKAGSSACIATGDYNLKSNTLGYKLIVNSTRLTDSWLHLHENATTEQGATCDKRSNIYTSASSLKSEPYGQRIDYILYSGNVKCNKCNTTMGNIPDQQIPFSDHEGVEAVFSIEQDYKDSCKDTQCWKEGYFENIVELKNLLNKGLAKTRLNFKNYLVILLLLLPLLVILCMMSYIFIAILATVAICFLLLQLVFILQLEMSGYQLYINIINNLMRCNKPI